tara:strand:- start:4383 stop:4598 length:216 start_codon:yes stop_codon:yes gene_type:complete
MDVRHQVGLNFRKMRTGSGWTQEQAAERTGVSQQYISGLERGRRNPTVLTLHELTAPFGKQPRDLLNPVTE